MKKKVLALIMALVMALASTACAASGNKSDNTESTSTAAQATTEESKDNKSEETVVTEVETESVVDADVTDNKLYNTLVAYVVEFLILAPEGILDYDQDYDKDFFEYAFVTSVQNLYDTEILGNPGSEAYLFLTEQDDYNEKSYDLSKFLVNDIKSYVLSNDITKEDFEEFMEIIEEKPSQFYEDVKAAAEAAE